MLELARRCGARKDRRGRRLVFMTFTAEESGLIGSRYYCDHPLFPLASTVAMINMDMIGRLQDDKLLVGGVGTAKEFSPLLDRLNRKHHFSLLREPSGQGPSDHSSFYAHNIPVLFLFTGFHEQYHRPTDRVETINVAGLRRVAGLVEDILGELGSAPQRPAFTKNSAGFARDKTLWAKAPSVGVMPDYGYKGEGVLVEGAVRNTPAARAGLKKGDRIVAVSGRPVKDAVAFLAVARTLPMGQKVAFTVVRDGKSQQVALQLALPRRPVDRRFGFALGLDDKGGLLLAEVPAGSPAAKAGLKKKGRQDRGHWRSAGGERGRLRPRPARRERRAEDQADGIPSRQAADGRGADGGPPWKATLTGPGVTGRTTAPTDGRRHRTAGSPRRRPPVRASAAGQPGPADSRPRGVVPAGTVLPSASPTDR